MSSSNGPSTGGVAPMEQDGEAQSLLQVIAGYKTKLEDEGVWRSLEQYMQSQHLQSTSSSAEVQEKLANTLLTEIELPLLFSCAYVAHQGSNASLQRTTAESLKGVFKTSVGARLLQTESQLAVPFFLAGLQDAGMPALRLLTAQILKDIAVVAVAKCKQKRTTEIKEGGGEDKDNTPVHELVCRQVLLRQPLIAGLVHAVCDGDLAVSQSVVECIVHAAEAVVAVALSPSASGQLAQQEQSASTVSEVLLGVMVQVKDAAAALPFEGVSGGTLRLRYAELVAKMSATGEAAMQACQQSGAIDEVLLPLLKSDDVLLQLNALELLEYLCATQSGVVMLFKDGHVQSLLSLVSGEDGQEVNANASMLGGSALRVIGAIYSRAAQTNAAALTREAASSLEAALAPSQQPLQATSTIPLSSTVGGGGGVSFDWTQVDPSLARRFLRAAMTYAESNSESSKLSALDAISTFAASSPAALKAVLEDVSEGADGATLCDVWLNIKHVPKAELKAVVLHSIARVFGQPPLTLAQEGGSGTVSSTTTNGVMAPGKLQQGNFSEEEVRQLSMRLFNAIGVYNGGFPTMELLMKLLGQLPLLEVRCAVYDVLRCVAWQPGGWGLRAMYGYHGWEEFLKDRLTETTKKGMEWKFSVMEAIFMCPDRKEVLDEDKLSEVHKMLKQGPFWRPKPNYDLDTT